MTLTVTTKIGREAWLQGYSHSSQGIYKIGFDLFVKFMNETEKGDWDDLRILREREEDVKSRTFAFEQKLIEFYEWLKTYNSNFSDNTRKSYLRSVRSFLAYHRLDVKLTMQQRSKISRKAKPKRKYYDYTLEDLKKMTSVAKPKEKYILLVGKELGLRAVDFVNLKQGTFIAHLNEELPISLGEIYTVKEGTSAKLFLGYDGKQAVDQWLTVLKSKGRYDPEKPMLEIGENELTEALKRLTKRAGVNIGNQQVRFHQLRVFLITRLSKVLETNRWKQIVGKSVPESSYVKPFELKEDYEKVLPLITVNTTASIPEKHEIQKLKSMISGYAIEIDSLKTNIETLKSEVESFKKIMVQRSAFQEFMLDTLSKIESKDVSKVIKDFIEKRAKSS